MPAEPREYLILRNLQQALLAIAVASGYHYDVKALAVKLDPNHNVEDLIAPEGPRPFVILELRAERWVYYPANVMNLVLPWTIHWVHDSDPTIDEDRVRMFFRGCADVEAAIVPATGRGGLAIDTRIVNRELQKNGPDDGSQVWAAIDLEIKLERTYGQPNG